MSLRRLLTAVTVLAVVGGAASGSAAQDAPQSIATFDQMPKTVTLPDGTLMAFFTR